MLNAARLALMLGYTITAASLSQMHKLLTVGCEAGASDWLPSTDSAFADWSANFTTRLTAAPTTIGLIAGDATAYATLNTNSQTAYTATLNPATRTSSTIATKDTAKIAAMNKARDLVAIAQAYPGTTNTLRTDFGMPVRDFVPTPIGAPTTKPVGNVERILNLEHVIRIRDEATPLSNGRPYGTVGAEVWVKYGPVAPLNLSECAYLGMATRVPVSFVHPLAQANATAHYLLVWISPRGERGPLSDGFSATIAA